MLAKDLAKAIAQHKGIVFVQTNWTSETWIQVVKKDIIEHFKKKGNEETGLLLSVWSERAYIDADYDIVSAEIEKELRERNY